MDKTCPCKDVIDLQDIVDKQRDQLAEGSTQFAVINTKLNLVIGVMSSIGVALVGVIIKLILGV